MTWRALDAQLVAADRSTEAVRKSTPEEANVELANPE